jgi:sporulation protein YlmC with PRC-barrel domain
MRHTTDGLFAAQARDTSQIRVECLIEGNFQMRLQAAMIGLVLSLALGGVALAGAASIAVNADRPFAIAQAMVPPTGMNDADKPMPMQDRMSRRYPQPVRVGDLVGLPVLDMNASTIGRVQQVVRTSQNKIELIVSYGRWFGWNARPVAVPIEVVGIEGRQLVSLDMPRSDYETAATWQNAGATVLTVDDSIRIALARN